MATVQAFRPPNTAQKSPLPLSVISNGNNRPKYQKKKTSLLREHTCVSVISDVNLIMIQDGGTRKKRLLVGHKDSSTHKRILRSLVLVHDTILKFDEWNFSKLAETVL